MDVIRNSTSTVLMLPARSVEFGSWRRPWTARVLTIDMQGCAEPTVIAFISGSWRRYSSGRVGAYRGTGGTRCVGSTHRAVGVHRAAPRCEKELLKGPLKTKFA